MNSQKINMTRMFSLPASLSSRGGYPHEACGFILPQNLFLSFLSGPPRSWHRYFFFSLNVILYHKLDGESYLLNQNQHLFYKDLTRHVFRKLLCFWTIAWILQLFSVHTFLQVPRKQSATAGVSSSHTRHLGLLHSNGFSVTPKCLLWE